jgi:hypothetical protein
VLGHHQQFQGRIRIAPRRKPVPTPNQLTPEAAPGASSTAKGQSEAIQRANREQLQPLLAHVVDRVETRDKKVIRMCGCQPLGRSSWPNAL